MKMLRDKLCGFIRDTRPLATIMILLMLSACANADKVQETSAQHDPNPAAKENVSPDNASADNGGTVKESIRYDELRKKITYGMATLHEVRQALTEDDVGALTNTVHALYSMKWHRGVINLLYDVWKLEKNKYPELAWDLLEKAPVRIALASTINRIQILNTDEYKAYIRSHENDEHEFHRAQVVVALGLNGDPVDLPYLKSMAEGDDVYVAQSAITGLALMANNQARDVLIELGKKYARDARGQLIREVLKKAYHWPPAKNQTETRPQG